MNRFRRIAVLAATAVLFFSSAGADGFAKYLTDGEIPSLKERYVGRIEIGVEAEAALEADGSGLRLITEQCGMLVCDTQTRGYIMLDRGSSKRKKDPGHAKVYVGKASEALNLAKENGMHVRAGTIVRTEDVPAWFFNEDYASSSSARKVDRKTAALRMENAIRDQMELLNERYPGIITEWTVVRGGSRTGQDLFRETIGEDYIPLAFRTARECAADGQKLFWQLPCLPDEEEIGLLFRLREEGLTDGLIVECCLEQGETDLQAMEETLQRISDAGLEIRLAGLEIADTDRTAAGQIRLASTYKNLFSMAERLSTVGGISFPALQDRNDRTEKKTPPRLFSVKGNCNVVLFGAMQDADIPTENDDDMIRAAADKLDLDTYLKKEEKPVIVYKKAENHNPVMVQRFGADPWAMVYRDRVYLYMTGDEPAVRDGEKPKTNDYSNIVTLRILSSDDLVNWTDHGSVRAAGRNGAAKWASNSWAPCAAWKNIDGQDKFFLYFANSGGGIGVLTADSPTGPFTDPIGKPLISRATPTCASVTWLFDPAVMVDEDGSAYLYFGGGIPDGKAADPGTARVVKLGEDMISLDGNPVPFNPPWLFEDSGINRFGDTYVYSYCSNFNVPSMGSKQGFTSGEIVYMTSDSPMGTFSYAGRVLLNPGSFFGVGGNNHHCMFSFRDQWYITYHAATLDKAMGWNAGYRSVFIDRLELNEKGLPAPSKGTYTGVAQLQAFDPYARVSAATAVTMAGATTELAYAADKKAGTGSMAVTSTSSGGWIAVAGADFGSEGASSVRLLVRSEVPSRIEIIPDSAEGVPVVTLDIPVCTEDAVVRAEIPEPLSGIHDLYFRFTERGTSLLEWQFE